MTTFQLQRTRNKGAVDVKYVQWTAGYAQCKGTDGVLYPLASFTCNANFLKLCNEFNIWDSGRDNSIQR